MSVTKEITRLEKSNVKLSMTIPKEEIKSQYRDILRDYSQKVQIPGFRKGKVPQEVLERKFGDALKGEALEKIIQKAVEEVFGDEGLSRDERPLSYSQPVLQEDPKLDLEQDLNFSLVYDVFPEINIDRWKGLEVEIPQAEITDDDIMRELEEVRDRNSFVLDREEGAEAKKGDTVTVSYYETDEDGVELPNTRRDDFVFTLGRGQNTHEIDDDIAGMKKGETKEVTKAYPDSTTGNTAPESLAGKTRKLRITLNELKEKKLPDLDDDFAQDVDEKFKTLDDLRNSIRQRLEKNLESQLRNLKINKILEKIMENTPVVLPESMVRAEFDSRLRNLARQIGADTEKVRQMLSETGDGLGSIEEQWRPSAEKDLHSRLIVEKLVEDQHIEASDEDMERELERIAADSGSPPEEVKKYYSEPNAAEYLKENIKENRFFDMLLAENNIKAGSKVNYLDVIANNG